MDLEPGVIDAVSDLGKIIRSTNSRSISLSKCQICCNSRDLLQLIINYISIFSYFLISRQIKSGPYKSLYRPGNMISGKEDAANNFARGHYTVGKEILEDVLEEVKS